MAIDGTLRPDTSTMNTVTAMMATGSDTGGRLTTSSIGMIESTAMTIKTVLLPWRSESFPMIRDETIVASPPKK